MPRCRDASLPAALEHSQDQRFRHRKALKTCCNDRILVFKWYESWRLKTSGWNQQKCKDFRLRTELKRNRRRRGRGMKRRKKKKKGKISPKAFWHVRSAWNKDLSNLQPTNVQVATDPPPPTTRQKDLTRIAVIIDLTVDLTLPCLRSDNTLAAVSTLHRMATAPREPRPGIESLHLEAKDIAASTVILRSEVITEVMLRYVWYRLKYT